MGIFKNQLLVVSICAACFLNGQHAYAKDYKLGVVLFHDYNYKHNIDKIINEIASNDIYRENNGDTLQLVVQTEISWQDTNPSQRYYDFSKFVEYAKQMKERGIKWTPLFSPHYVPKWARTKYYNDLTTDKHGNKLAGNFLHFSPSSSIWENEIKEWIDEGLNVLSPYIGNSKNDVISEILVTNEMMYHAGGVNYGDDANNSKISTYDDATIRAWNNRYAADYGVIPRNIINESPRRRNAFMKFRAEELAYCLNKIKYHADSKLRKLGKYDIPVTWKLVPFAFNKGPNTLEQYHGLTGSQLSYIFNSTNLRMIAIDSYQNNLGWDNIKNDIISVKNYDNDNKPIYLAEFNRIGGNATRDQIRDWITNTKNYNVTSWTFFSWNGSGSDHEGPIQYEQKQGLKLAFNTLIAPDGTHNDPIKKIEQSPIITNHQNKVSQYIDKCISTLSKYCGSKVGEKYSCKENSLCQETTGGQLANVTNIAIDKNITGNEFYYYWDAYGGWSKNGLTLSYCGITKKDENNSTNKVLESLGASCPSTVLEGNSINCKAIAYYTDGTNETATNLVAWSVESPFASINNNGKLTADAVDSDTKITVKVKYSKGGVSKNKYAFTTIKDNSVSTNKVLESLGTSCPSTVLEGNSINCKAIAYYTDGTNETATNLVAWSVESPFASINNNGK